MRRPIRVACLILLSALSPALADKAPATRPTTLPAGYKTVKDAVSATIKTTASSISQQAGYLGISVSSSAGKTMIEDVDPQSPAALAGFAAGDRLVSLNGNEISHGGELAEILLAQSAGGTVKAVVERKGQKKDLSATLGPVSRPMKSSGTRSVIGVNLRETPDSDGAQISSVTPDLPAAKAGLKTGDIITKIDEAAVGATTSISELLAGYEPGDEVTIKYRRENKTDEVKVKLAADVRAGSDVRAYSPANIFKKDTYRLAIIGIEYPDNKHSEKISPKDWEEAMFSKGTYTDKNATGQTVYGSMNDYYQEVSCGKLKVEGKMFPWVEVSKNRSDYGQGTGDTRLLNEAIDKLQARDGKDVLKGFDGLIFLYAGPRMQTNRGNIYWPHKGFMLHQGKRWTFFICPEGGDRMVNISVFTHEFGHMLGLPDLYARPENPGSEGLGQWCLMSNQIGNGRPQHMSAWCKEQLGWVTPTIIDPGVKQKLVLSPIEGTTDQCFKVLARPDGSEYFLLEVRKKSGFDTDLPGEGLLVWRVVRGRVMLEESHGVEGPLGPRSYLKMVPFPSNANRAFTPYTTPSSRPQLGGGTPVFITDIEKLPDGRVTFRIGYEVY